MSLIPAGIIKTPEGIYVLEYDTHLSRWIEEHGRLDVAGGEIMENFAKYIPQGGVVVDAGASLGDHVATYAKLVGPTGSVYAFEPNPLPSRALALNFANAKNVTVIPVGLSDREQRAIVCQNDNVGASHLCALFPGDNKNDAVTCRPLDSILRDIQRLDFIHLDCEGMELRALMGAQRLLAQFKPVIALEVNVSCLLRLGISQGAIWEFLINAGYRVEELDPGADPKTCPQRDVIALPL